MTRTNRVLFRLAAGLTTALALQAVHASDDPCFEKAQSQAALNQCASAKIRGERTDSLRLHTGQNLRLQFKRLRHAGNLGFRYTRSLWECAPHDLRCLLKTALELRAADSFDIDCNSRHTSTFWECDASRRCV